MSGALPPLPNTAWFLVKHRDKFTASCVRNRPTRWGHSWCFRPHTHSPKWSRRQPVLTAVKHGDWPFIWRKFPLFSRWMQFTWRCLHDGKHLPSLPADTKESMSAPATPSEQLPPPVPPLEITASIITAGNQDIISSDSLVQSSHKLDDGGDGSPLPPALPPRPPPRPRQPQGGAAGAAALAQLATADQLEELAPGLQQHIGARGECPSIWPLSDDCPAADTNIGKESDSMGQVPYWEADSHSASQEIPRLLWNSKVHCRVHKSPPLVCILREIQLLLTIPHYFPKIHSNIILSSTPRSSEWSHSLRFSNQNIVCVSHLPGVPHAPLICNPISGRNVRLKEKKSYVRSRNFRMWFLRPGIDSPL
jgi:hypothetical protein